MTIQKTFSIVIILLYSIGQSCNPSDDGTKDEQADHRPLNVLFIAVDDLRPELGSYGKRDVHSPNIDRLAEQGLVFENAYCQQSVCSPSRTSLLTGLRPDSTHVYDLTTHFRSTVPAVITLPQYFKQHGYSTEWWGKIFHAALLDSISWTKQGERLEPEDNWRAYVLDESLRLAAENDGGGPPFEAADVPDNAYPDGQIADRAVEALRAVQDRPFFLAIGFYKPHLPFNAPQQYWDLYDPEDVSLSPLDQWPYDAPDIAKMEWHELRAYHGIPEQGPLDDEMTRALIQGYMACVSYTDAQVGRLLDELDLLELTDRTIIVLWGDHGWKLGEYSAWCKHTNFEIDTRTTLIVSVPAMETAGQRTTALVELVDLYPTLVELAGLPLPHHLQGTSFIPLLQDPQQHWKSVALSQYPRQDSIMGYSLRNARYRFTRWASTHGSNDGAVYELYDHLTESLEQTNLANLPEYAELVQKLDSLLDKSIRQSLIPYGERSR